MTRGTEFEVLFVFLLFLDGTMVTINFYYNKQTEKLNQIQNKICLLYIIDANIHLHALGKKLVIA